MDEASAQTTPPHQNARPDPETVRKHNKLQLRSTTTTRKRQERTIDEANSQNTPATANPRSDSEIVSKSRRSQPRSQSVVSRRPEQGVDEAAAHNMLHVASPRSDLKSIPKAKRSQSRFNPVASGPPEYAPEEIVLNSVLNHVFATAENHEEECAKLRAENTKLQDDLKAVATAETSAAFHEAENLKLHAQNTKLERDLKEAHDFVFSLQPRQTSLTESEAAPAFKTLCDSVENWVDRELSDFISEKAAYKMMSGLYAKRFIKYIVLPGRQCSELPETDEYNIIAAIMRYLYVKVFDRDFYCAEDGDVQFFDSLQASMQSLTPRRGRSLLLHTLSAPILI